MLDYTLSLPCISPLVESAQIKREEGTNKEEVPARKAHKPFQDCWSFNLIMVPQKHLPPYPFISYQAGPYLNITVLNGLFYRNFLYIAYLPWDIIKLPLILCKNTAKRVSALSSKTKLNQGFRTEI